MGKTVRRNLLEADLQSVSACTPKRSTTITSVVNAMKSPKTPFRIHQLYSFGEGQMLSEVLLDPATPVALVGSFGQFTNRSSEISGFHTPILCLTPTIPGSDSFVRFAHSNPRKKLESKLVDVHDDSHIKDSCDGSSKRRVTIEMLDDSPADLFGSDSVLNGRGSRKKRLEYGLNVWEDNHRERSASLECGDDSVHKLSELATLSGKIAMSEQHDHTAVFNLQASFSKESRDASKSCKCKKSKCIRQYCVCFRLERLPSSVARSKLIFQLCDRAGDLCKGCECVECYNDGQHEEDRKAAVEHIRTADPLAFVTKVRSTHEEDLADEDSKVGIQIAEIVEMSHSGAPSQQHVRGCKCKNSRCQKKYCECFEFGVTCSSRCTCKYCQNGKPSQGGDTDDNSAPNKKAKKAVPVAVDQEKARLALKEPNKSAYSISLSARAEKPIVAQAGELRKVAAINDPKLRKDENGGNTPRLDAAATPPMTPNHSLTREFLLAPSTPLDSQATANLSFASNWSISALSPMSCLLQEPSPKVS
mmetsp:Transcript_80375/g.215515  ORF Transcript_80375/g.215515 Transcript_80375/m.215515 type:complete len:532 (-) Transcript_80375:240-1835(-)